MIISGMIISGMIISGMIIPEILRAQTPRDTRATGAPAPTGSGALAGTVTADASGRPIAYAAVVIIGASTGALRVTATDADGRFAAAGLPADRYLVGASKAPYLGAVAGARRPARPGTPVAVGDGQKVSDVAIRLPLGAVIAGMIADERGQPAAGTLVGVQQWRLQGGERTLVNGQVAITDDRGRYRIYGLAPGEYVVSGYRPSSMSASPLGMRTLTDADVDRALRATTPAATDSPAPNDSAVRLAPVFYPGTTRMSDAATIALGAGDERSGLDFALQTVRTVRIDGSVATPDGPPTGQVMILLSSTGGPLQSGASARVMPDGHFTFPNVTPGSYTLSARTLQPVGGPGRGGDPNPILYQVATAAVDVAGSDVVGVQLTLHPPATLTGHVVFHGTTTAPSLGGRRVPFKSQGAAATGVIAPGIGATDDKGAFTITGLTPGRYVIGGPLFFGANADSLTWSLESVTADNRDITDLPLDVGDQAPANVVVAYTDRWQQVTGRLTTAAGAPAANYVILIFPANRAYWMQGTRRILTAHPGTDGRFTISGPGPSTLPPGDYLLAAVTDLDRDEQFDPALLATLVAGAVPVTLQPGDRKTQDLVVK
jgi:uncharacterized protein (DUF2141 family)